ncbi:protein VTE6, chloroplastic-like [Silene latifolia]|uniref:protein VTE6, chloroplastic-like n=1 Tax=Silene latifolia TaxID=37657 RepID=UPI003D77AFED
MASLQSHFLTPSLPSFPILSLPQQCLLPKLPLNFISNHHIHTFNPKFPSTKKMTSFLTTKASSIEIVASLVQSNPATWQSAIVSNALIFVLGSPVLVSGLSVSGIVSAFLLGTLTWRAFGFSGFVLVATYFVLGTAATKVKMAQKEAQGIAEKKKGRRGPASVIGSSAAGCVCACLSIYGIGGKALSQLWQLGFVASFCTKLSDTVSSEIGKAYGKTTYLVTTFKIVPRGTEGAVSVEGTLAGVLASILLACVGCLTGQINTTQAVVCVLASQIANFGESFIGATFQEKEGYQWLNNDVVNIINISIGSIFAILLQQVLQSCQR